VTPAPAGLSLRLDQVRALLRRRAGWAIGLGWGVLAGVLLLLAYLTLPPEGWTDGDSLPFLLLAGTLLGGGAISMLAHRALRRVIDEASLASAIERECQLPEGLVRSQVELQRRVPQGVSSSLVAAGEARLIQRLPGAPEALAGEAGRLWLGRARWSAALLLLTLVVVGVLTLLSPERTRSAWAGLANSGALLIRDPLPPLTVAPGDATLPRGALPLIEVGAVGRSEVTLHWQGVGEVLRMEVLAVAEGGAEGPLPPLETEVRYWVTSPDGARSQEFLLTPEDPSLLTQLSLEVAYPTYTRRPDESFRGLLPPRLELPEGSSLSLGGRVEGEGLGVLLVTEEGEVVARFPVSEGQFRGSWTPGVSGLLRWEVEGGLEGAILPPSVEITLVEDLPPRLELPIPGADIELSLTLRVPLLIEASDDYGIEWIEIEATRADPQGSEIPGSLDRIPVGELPVVLLRPVLDFNAWALLPGEEILLRVRASDNRPVGQVTTSPTYRLRMPGQEELRELARERIDEASGRAEELVERAARETAQLQQLEREERLTPSTGNSAGAERERFERREELRQALERQAELTREVDAVREELEEVREAMAPETPEDVELRERIAELERLLEEVLGDGMQERVEQLMSQLQGGEMPQATGELLQELLARQEMLQSRLEQALERLERTAIEEGFRGSEEELRALSQAQEELVPELREGRGAERQEELDSRAESLEERLAGLRDRLDRSGEREAAEQAGVAQEDLGRARGAMAEGTAAGAQGRGEEAAQAGAEAAASLQSALQELEEAREAWTEDQEAAMREGLRAGAQGALTLARRQGELARAFENAGPQRRSEFVGELAALMDGLRNLATGLADATRELPQVARELSQAVARAMNGVSSALEGLGRPQGPIPAAVSAATEAQRAMNEVARLALDALAQGEGDSQGSQSSAQALEELENLTAMQTVLNRDAMTMSNEIDPDGRIPRLTQMAEAQEMIAGQMGELAQLPQGGQDTQRLEEMAALGREIADELAAGRLDAGVLEAQERLLDRMLEAGRTLERDRPTEEREGSRPLPGERVAPSPLPAYLLDPTALQLPTREEMESLSPIERRMILDYFDRVNRRRATGGLP